MGIGYICPPNRASLRVMYLSLPRDHDYLFYTSDYSHILMTMQSKMMLPRLASLVLASALTLSGLDGLFAQQSSDRAEVTSQSVALLQQINPTTFEVRFHSGRRLTLDFYADHIVRLFEDPQGGILRSPVATPPAQILVDQPRRATSEIQLRQEGDDFVLSSAALELHVSRGSGLIRLVERKGGRTILQQSGAIRFDRDGAKIDFVAQEGEYFYGGGVQNGRFSHRGKVIAIENTNNWVDGGVASPTPFYWSTAGYGVMWHTFKPGKYDFDSKGEGRVALSHSEHYLDLFVMASPTPVGLLQAFYQLTGNPVLMPKFAFYQGHLNAYNRDYWKEDPKGRVLMPDGKRYREDQKDNGGIKESLNGEKGNYLFSARAALDRYLDNDMPLGWFLPNDGYGAGYGQEKTLDGNILNLKSFGDYARSRGVEIGLWTQSDLHPKEGIEALLQRDIVKEVRDAGVRALKTDVAWVGAGYSFGLNGVADVGHIMPYYGGDARPFIISLDGWAGTQRYATIWSGDQTGGEWEYIRFHIPTFIGSGLSGQPNITSDVDGIFGGNNLPVNVREFQWKTFTPMELNMDGWGSTPKYPDVLGEPATSINRWYLKLKAELMPYAYTIAHEAIEGKPMIRAMFLDYPNAYTLGTATQYQFLYGPYLLVAPIYQATKMDARGNDVRHGIYLPEGKWIDYYTGHSYEGGRIINDFDAPLWKLPVLVKAGAILPMTHPHNTPREVRRDYRTYELYPYGKSEFVEYDDDGESEAYRRGVYAQTPLSTSLEGDRLSVRIAPTQVKGSIKGFEAVKETELRINISRPAKGVKVRINGRRVKLQEVHSREAWTEATNALYYEARPNLNRFATKGSEFAREEIIKNPQLLIKLAKVDTEHSTIEVEVSGYHYDHSDHLLSHTGTLAAPEVHFVEAQESAYSLRPSWTPQPEADYYEIEHEGMLYSTIRGGGLEFASLRPETEYTLRVRAVNRSGHSSWTEVKHRTLSDPLEFAIQGISGQTSCANQGSQGIDKLFDRDEKSVWHTAWSGKAVPFDLTIDLKGVNSLDSLVYIPREDVGNGTILTGTYSISTDKLSWSTPKEIKWMRNADHKTIRFEAGQRARYIRLHITEAVGNYGSGRELYVFKTPGTESLLQGDINRDKSIDENDFTSYLNYTGLRSKDSDFDYVSLGDLNRNGLIDAYDISHVSTMLAGGSRPRSEDVVAGKLVMTADRAEVKAGEELTLTIRGSQDMKAVNAFSLAIPYDATEWEWLGVETPGTKQMTNLTYDRLHSDGTKALYPTFVNVGHEATLSGDAPLLIIKFRAKRNTRVPLKVIDGLLVDRALGVVSF